MKTVPILLTILVVIGCQRQEAPVIPGDPVKNAEMMKKMKPGGAPAERDPEWASISEPVWKGDIAVSIDWLKVGPVTFLEKLAAAGKERQAPLPAEKPQPSKEKYFIIQMTIVNKGAEPFQYVHPRKDEVKLADEKGNVLAAVNEDDPRPVDGQVRSAMVKPKEGVADSLIFSAANLHKGEFLLLQLPAKRFGATGTIKFKMEQSRIR